MKSYKLFDYQKNKTLCFNSINANYFEIVGDIATFYIKNDLQQITPVAAINLKKCWFVEDV
jgi:hypothetical protein